MPNASPQHLLANALIPSVAPRQPILGWPHGGEAAGSTPGRPIFDGIPRQG